LLGRPFAPQARAQFQLSFLERAARELHPTGTPNFDAVCFHAEQCSEKLIKALLMHLCVTLPRSHDRAAVDRLLTPVCPAWSWPVSELRLLTRAAGDF
jgi:hypothetical protein